MLGGCLMIQRNLNRFQDATGDEFVQLIYVLSNSRLTQSPLGQKDLVDIIADQAELDHPFDPEDHSQIDRLIHCTYCAIPYVGVSIICKSTLYDFLRSSLT